MVNALTAVHFVDVWRGKPGEAQVIETARAGMLQALDRGLIEFSAPFEVFDRRWQEICKSGPTLPDNPGRDETSEDPGYPGANSHSAT